MWLSLFIFLINHVEIMNARSYKIYFLKCTTTRLQLNIKIKRKTILILQHFANSATTCTLIINNCSHSKTDTCRLAAVSRTTEFQNNTEKQIFVNQNMSLLSQKFKNERKTSNTGLKANTTHHKKREREAIWNVNLCLCFNFINTKKKNTQSTACHRRRRRSGRDFYLELWLKGTQKIS